MDIYSAEIAVKKLLNYVQSVSDADQTLYKSSKQRLQNVSNMCSEIIKLVSDILESEMLSTDCQEFESNVDEVIRNNVSDLGSDLNRLQKFTDNEQTNLLDDANLLSSTEKRKIVTTYGNQLKRGKAMSCGYSLVDRCAEIIWRWFNARIFTKYSNAPPFRYDVRRFKDIIYSFVIVYGYHIENNTHDEFYNEVNEWIDSLSTSSESNKWIAPYSVYQVEKNQVEYFSKYANSTAAVIWDILVDNQYKCLCVPSNDFYLDSYGVWKKLEAFNPDVLDNYVNYKEDNNIVHILN